MKIQSLRLENFRKFQSQLFIFNPRFTVLIGRNATGKTQILDALAIILGTYLTKVFKREKAIRKIANEEIRIVDHTFLDSSGATQYRREMQYPVKLTASILFRKERPLTQSCCLRSEKGRTTFGGNTDFLLIAKKDAENVAQGKEVTLPFLAYYGAGRLWPLKRHVETDMSVSSRLDGYRDSLDPNSDIKGLQSWIKKYEIISLQKKTKITALELVRQVVIEMIPNCMRLYYDAELDYVSIIFKDGENCPFYNLSDGFRCMVSMVADMTRRIVNLNPHLGDNAIKETEGVVLIDELDLYLHPEWQRRVVDDLKRVFPKLQFIATTHSPFIIQSLQSGEVIDLEQCNPNVNNNESLQKNRKVVKSCANPVTKNPMAWPGPSDPYKGRSIEDIVESIMGVSVPQRSERYQKMYDTAKEYYRMLHEESQINPEAKELLKRKLDELIAPFSDDVAYHAFLEMERIAWFSKENKK